MGFGLEALKSLTIKCKGTCWTSKFSVWGWPSNPQVIFHGLSGIERQIEKKKRKGEGEG